MSDIRTLRRSSGLRLKDLAQLANVSPTELSKCERGLTVPNTTFFAVIGKALGVDATTLEKFHAEHVKAATPGEGYTTTKPEDGVVYQRKTAIAEAKILIIDLFCGTGGFSHGFQQTGAFQVVLGIDLLKDRALTFSHNHPTATVMVDHIEKIDIKQFAQLAPMPDVVIGGRIKLGILGWFSLVGKIGIRSRSQNTTRNFCIPALFTTAVLPESPSVLLLLKSCSSNNPIRSSQIQTILPRNEREKVPSSSART